MKMLKKNYQSPKLELVELVENQVFMVGSASEDSDATGSGEDFPWATFENVNVWEQ